MNFDWTKYLDVARLLVKAYPEDDAMLRSAASRAYYASFHQARDYIRTNFPYVTLEVRREHEQIPSTLKERVRTVAEKRAAKDLESLKVLRHWADYKRFPKDRTRDLVTSALLDAQRVIDNLPVVVPTQQSQ